MAHIEAQAPEGMPLLALEVVECLRDLLDRRSQPGRRKPASVSETLRVVRFNNRTPMRSSKCRIVWLSAEGVTPRREAAARKLRLSATATNAARSARSARRIAEFRLAPNATNIAFDLGRDEHFRRVQSCAPCHRPGYAVRPNGVFDAT